MSGNVWSRIAAVIGLLAVATPASAQYYQPLYWPFRGSTGTFVPYDATDPDADWSNIAAASEKEITGKSYFVKAGATREQYHRDWQTCRLIAKGTPYSIGGSPYYYDAGNTSLADGMGMVVGGMLIGGMAIADMERGFRRQCLLVKGWRVIRPPVAIGARITQMAKDGEKREIFLNWLLGQEQPKGKIIAEWTEKRVPADPALGLDLPAPGPPNVYISGTTQDLPAKIADGEAYVVIGFRRPIEGSKGAAASLLFRKYDPDLRDLHLPASVIDEKSKVVEVDRAADTTTYDFSFVSKDRMSVYEVQVTKVTPGYYVIDQAHFAETNCFGAPLIQVPAGFATYVGDWIPIKEVELSTGEIVKATIALSSHFEETQSALGVIQPDLAQSMVPMKIANNARYSCKGNVSKWSLYGIPDIAELEQAETAQGSTEASGSAANVSHDGG